MKSEGGMKWLNRSKTLASTLNRRLSSGVVSAGERHELDVSSQRLLPQAGRWNLRGYNTYKLNTVEYLLCAWLSVNTFTFIITFNPHNKHMR